MIFTGFLKIYTGDVQLYIRYALGVCINADLTKLSAWASENGLLLNHG